MSSEKPTVAEALEANLYSLLCPECEAELRTVHPFCAAHTKYRAALPVLEAALAQPQRVREWCLKHDSRQGNPEQRGHNIYAESGVLWCVPCDESCEV